MYYNTDSFIIAIIRTVNYVNRTEEKRTVNIRHRQIFNRPQQNRSEQNRKEQNRTDIEPLILDISRTKQIKTDLTSRF